MHIIMRLNLVIILVSWQKTESGFCIVILVGFLLMAGINIASGAAPVFRMHKLTIVDGIRNEDF